MAEQRPPNNKPRVDVAQLVSRGLRLELMISRDGGPAELITSFGTDRLMIIANLIAAGFKLETTGAEALGPHTVDTLIRVRDRAPQPSTTPPQRPNQPPSNSLPPQPRRPA